jgi:hypothetical protein
MVENFILGWKISGKILHARDLYKDYLVLHLYLNISLLKDK